LTAASTQDARDPTKYGWRAAAAYYTSDSSSPLHHGVSGRRGSGGVRSRTSRRSNTTCALIGTIPDALKALRQFSDGSWGKDVTRATSCKQTTLIALHKAITTADRTIHISSCIATFSHCLHCNTFHVVSLTHLVTGDMRLLSSVRTGQCFDQVYTSIRISSEMLLSTDTIKGAAHHLKPRRVRCPSLYPASPRALTSAPCRAASSPPPRGLYMKPPGVRC
jgi:hypothetical protein